MTSHTPLTILVIDDERGVVRGLARLLRRDGYSVGTAANGEHALTQLPEQRYDLVLCDLRIPGLDGPAFYDRFLRQSPALCQRVIVLMGDTLRADSTAFLEQCGQPWLPKPCNAAEVRSAIAQVRHAAPPAHERQVVG